MLPRILFVQTFYDEFLHGLYAKCPTLRELDFDGQSQRVFATGFGVGDVHSTQLRALGCETREEISNADVLQAQWASEHRLSLDGNIHKRMGRRLFG